MGIFSLFSRSKPSRSLDTSNPLHIHLMLLKCRTIDEVLRLHNSYKEFDHPHVAFVFGITFLKFGDTSRAREEFIKGAMYGAKYPSSYLNTPFVDAIGQCYMNLMTQFPVQDEDSASKATALSYLYLTNAINQMPRKAFDSYKYRGFLFQFNEVHHLPMSLIHEMGGIGMIAEPFIISDYYFAAMSPNNPHSEVMNRAVELHRSLEDITVQNKDADEYTTAEIADIGEKRHEFFYRLLTQEGFEERYSMTKDELYRLNYLE